jgi:hypothetical protein
MDISAENYDIHTAGVNIQDISDKFSINIFQKA